MPRLNFLTAILIHRFCLQAHAFYAGGGLQNAKASFSTPASEWMVTMKCGAAFNATWNNCRRFLRLQSSRFSMSRTTTSEEKEEPSTQGCVNGFFRLFFTASGFGWTAMARFTAAKVRVASLMLAVMRDEV